MTNKKRLDIHCPSAIKPEDYQFVANEYLKVEDLGTALFLQAEREAIRNHMKRTGGNYASVETNGNCMVCGSVNAIYTVLFYHEISNTYVRMGSDCAVKCDMSTYGMNAFRAAIEDARLAQAGQKKALAILTDMKLVKCFDIYRSIEKPGKEEDIVTNIVEKLVKYGNISIPQEKYLHVLVKNIENRAETEAKRKAELENAADCPSGRVDIEGVVLTLKDKDTPYGIITKMLVKHDSGYTVWGARPKGAIGCVRGDCVSFTASVTVSNNDKKFGYFNRPTNGKIVNTSNTVAA